MKHTSYGFYFQCSFYCCCKLFLIWDSTGLKTYYRDIRNPEQFHRYYPMFEDSIVCPEQPSEAVVMFRDCVWWQKGLLNEGTVS